MALNKRQKRRLKDSASMIKNARLMALEIEEIDSEYTLELGELIKKIRNEVIKDLKEPDISSEPEGSKRRRPFRSKNSRDFRVKFDKQELSIYQPKQEKSHFDHLDIDESLPEDINVPAWAKEIWRKIMLCCHPDRIKNSKLSMQEINSKHRILLDATACKEKKDWNELLFLGILIDQYTEKLNQKKQLDNLNGLYSIVVEKINTIQASTTWLWGTNWDSPEVRFKILSAVLQANNVDPPNKNRIMEIINELEAE